MGTYYYNKPNRNAYENSENGFKLLSAEQFGVKFGRFFFPLGSSPTNY